MPSLETSVAPSLLMHIGKGQSYISTEKNSVAGTLIPISTPPSTCLMTFGRIWSDFSTFNKPPGRIGSPALENYPPCPQLGLWSMVAFKWISTLRMLNHSKENQVSVSHQCVWTPMLLNSNRNIKNVVKHEHIDEWDVWHAKSLLHMSSHKRGRRYQGSSTKIPGPQTSSQSINCQL